MFYFDKFLNKPVLKSDKIPVFHFFTTRDFILKTKEPKNLALMEANRREAAGALGLKAIITPCQRHTTNIALAEIGANFDDTDGLLLSDRELGIFLNFADCTPIIFYDFEKNLAGIAHAGWRGTAGEIAAKTVQKMEEVFKSRPSGITALIGPCICRRCFETTEEIALNLAGTVKNGFEFVSRQNDKFFADLAGINCAQLKEAGVENVDIAPFCTYHNNDKFFSYRRENKTTDRMSAFICLKSVR